MPEKFWKSVDEVGVVFVVTIALQYLSAYVLSKPAVNPTKNLEKNAEIAVLSSPPLFFHH